MKPRLVWYAKWRVWSVTHAALLLSSEDWVRLTNFAKQLTTLNRSTHEH